MAVDGTYNIQYASPGGLENIKVTLETADSSLNGTCFTGKETRPLSDGKVAGDDVEFAYVHPTPVGNMKVFFKGKVSGDEISGVVRLGGPFGSRPFKGKRV